MKEIPILFSTEMVKAILEGRKTQTRRVMKIQPDFEPSFCIVDSILSIWKYQFAKGKFPKCSGAASKPFLCPFGKPGDLLWVRETWVWWDGDDVYGPGYYYAETFGQKENVPKGFPSWKPSIHMPKAAARIWLEVTAVRVERLQDISERDCIAEGIESFRPVPGDGGAETYYKMYDTGKFAPFSKRSFESLWESINGPGSWEQNPWVWVITFKKVERNGLQNN